MSADRVVAGLLRIASEDLEAARLLTPNGSRNAIYLCEQAAEKLDEFRYVGSGGRIPLSPSVQELHGFVSRVQRALDFGGRRPRVNLHDPNQPAKSPEPLRAGEQLCRLADCTYNGHSVNLAVSSGGHGKPLGGLIVK